MGLLTKDLLLKLRQWCDQEYGRKSEVARYLGIPAQALSNMFRAQDPQQPTGEQVLAIQNFLKAHQRRKPKASAKDKSDT